MTAGQSREPDLPETLAIASVEQFLTRHEREAILTHIRTWCASLPPDRTSQQQRSRSVHSVPGLSLPEVMRVYEPEGRLELDEVPAEVERLLASAAARALPALRRVYPSARTIGDWIYLEYGPGQFITPHIDGTDRDEHSRQLAGISICLCDDYTGGAFEVATSSSDRLFDATGRSRVGAGADNSKPWFASLARTQWSCRPRAGDAICYGSRLVHSTQPVLSGIAKKAIGFLVC